MDFETLIAEKLDTSTTALSEYFYQHKQKLAEDLFNTLAPLVEMAKYQQIAGVKEPLACLHIAFLRSCIAAQTYEFRLALCSKDLWTDPIETAVYWDASFIFQYVEQDVSEVVGILKRQAPLSDFDVREMKYKYALDFLPTAQIIVEELMLEALSKVDLEGLKFDESLTVVHGGYMEGGTVI